jgi:hypothetical protein
MAAPLLCALGPGFQYITDWKLLLLFHHESDRSGDMEMRDPSQFNDTGARDGSKLRE